MAFQSCLLLTLFINIFAIQIVEPKLPNTLSNIASDREDLLSFRSALRYEPQSPISTWSKTSSPCNWTGVLCSNKAGPRVVGLDLSGFGLSGPTSPHIGNLSALQSLNLQSNRFTGPIPQEITKLSHLRVLNMSSNFMQGFLPKNMSHLGALIALYLMSNYRIIGPIPGDDLSRMTKLEVLRLGGNNFTGEIPSSLGNLTSLRVLNLGTNSLSGVIPRELGLLRDLTELDVRANELSGLIPNSVYNLSSLTMLVVGLNKLTGEIRHDIGERLPSLEVLILCFNRITGVIPPSLHNLTRARDLRTAHNFHVGTVPRGLGNLPSLHTYNIGYNKLVSDNNGLSFITELVNSTKLQHLAINYNLLEGVIPESVGNLSKVLSKLYMEGNRIYGRIPASFGRLKSLTLLNLSSNSLSGEIPPQLGELRELRMLGLAHNKISGIIPSSLSKLQRLNQLDLSGNSLTGEIPPSIGGFPHILLMDLSNNRLNGSIPEGTLNLPSLIFLFNLSNNLLAGPLPKEIGLLDNVEAIDLSNNLLSGEIPRSIENCKSLESLFMSNNQFSGPIPNSIGQIKGLEALDLSSNQLSGSIPIDLEKLRALKYLNLSFNNLEGVVPRGGLFNTSIDDVHLEGNIKLCLNSNRKCLKGGEGSRGRRFSRAFMIAAIPTTLALCLIIGLVFLYLWRRKAISAQASFESLHEKHQMVSYEELRRSTGDFSEENLVGKGSFGSVYIGFLREQGISVAVKVLNIGNNGSWKSFLAECEVLRNVRHRNLVTLITSCSITNFQSHEFLALVYEYLGNGSLEDWIRGKRRKANGSCLNIIERLKVAIDVACALDYMHHDCAVPVVHCDLKPSNILLDEDMTAKLGDFGLARLLMNNRDVQTSISSTHVLKGSIGYIPPEYGLGEKPSTAGDSYSFGVVLLELFTGKCPIDETFTDLLNLPQWVGSIFPQNLLQVIDSELLQLVENLYHEGQYVSPKLQYDCLTTIIETGLSCTTSSPSGRMSMSNALHHLKAAKDKLLKHTTRKRNY